MDLVIQNFDLVIQIPSADDMNKRIENDLKECEISQEDTVYHAKIKKLMIKLINAFKSYNTKQS